MKLISQCLKRLLENDGLPALNDKKKKKPSKKVISSDKAIKVDLLKERSINLPRLTNIHPDYPTQKAQLNINPPEYLKDEEPTESLSNKANEPEVFESIQEILVKDNSQTASSQDEGESERSLTPSSSESIFSEDFDDYEYDILNEERIQSFIFEDGLISTETMKYAQNTNPKINNLLQRKKEHLPINFEIYQGLLIYNKNEEKRIVLPESLINQIFRTLHEGTFGKHASVSQMTKKIKVDYKFLGNMKEILEDKVKKCPVCTAAKNIKRRALKLGTKVYATGPRRIWNLDLISGLNPVNRYTMILVMTDTFSLFTILTPLRSKEATELVKAVKNNLILHYGTPMELHFDNEPGFKSSIFERFAEENQIKLHFSMPYASFSNGLVESTVNGTKELIRAYVLQTGGQWPDLVIPLIPQP